MIEVDSSGEDEQPDRTDETASEKMIKNIKSQLDSLNQSYLKNEDLIRSAVEKQTGLKKKLKQYKTLISKGKFLKKSLNQKKAELLYQLASTKQSLIPKLSSVEIIKCSNKEAQTIAVSTESIINRPDMNGPQSPSVASTSSKRRLEFEELNKQLNRVQQELEQSKLGLIKNKDIKKKMKLDKKSKSSIPEPVEESPSDGTVESELTFSQNPTSILIDNQLYPAYILNKIKRFLRGKAEVSCSFQVDNSLKACISPGQYQSPLSWFRSSLYSSLYLYFVPKGGLLSTKYLNKIDPMVPFCKNEFTFGCSDKSCPFQHFNEIKLTDDELIERLIQGLVTLGNHDGKFEDTSEVLKLIQDKMSENGLHGLPIVSLASNLVQLKSDISSSPLTISCNNSIAQEPSWIKYDSMLMDTFISTLERIPCRSSIILGAVDQERRPNRYYNSKEVSDEAPTVEAYSKSPWFELIDSSSFAQTCALFTKMIGDVKSSIELFMLVMILVKKAIDSNMRNETRTIFLAILKSQMSIDNDDIVPCAQLCALPLELNWVHKVHLWMLFFYYLNSGSYPSSAFCIYPFDFIYNFSSFYFVNWTDPSTYTEALTVSHELLYNAPFSLDKLCEEWVVHNIFNLRMAQTKCVGTSLDGCSYLPSVFFTYLSLKMVPSTIVQENWSTPCSILNIVGLLSNNIKLLAMKNLDALKNRIQSGSHLSQLVEIIRKIAENERTEFEPNSLSFIEYNFHVAHFIYYFFSRSLILSEAQTCIYPLETLDYYSDVDIFELMKNSSLKVRISLEALEEPTSLDSVLEDLIVNPSDKNLWILYFLDFLWLLTFL